MFKQYNAKWIGSKVNGADSIPWEMMEPMVLSGVVNEEEPRLQTIAKACWTDEALYIHFDCEDDHVVATMNDRDDPIYNEDVVEVFIDEEGKGLKYIELEVSPKNVIVDALITNDGTGKIVVNKEWNAEGLLTDVQLQGSTRIYDIILPFVNVDKSPEPGTKWRWNVYRIDKDPSGTSHYWAWAPTGAVDFHLTHNYGIIHFVKE